MMGLRKCISGAILGIYIIVKFRGGGGGKVFPVSNRFEFEFHGIHRMQKDIITNFLSKKRPGKFIDHERINMTWLVVFVDVVFKMQSEIVPIQLTNFQSVCVRVFILLPETSHAWRTARHMSTAFARFANYGNLVDPFWRQKKPE